MQLQIRLASQIMSYRNTPLKLPWAFTSSSLYGALIFLHKFPPGILTYCPMSYFFFIIRVSRLVTHSGLLAYKIKILMGYY